MAVALTDLTVN